MKTLKDAILAVLGIVSLFAMAYLAGKSAITADLRSRAYWAQLNAHVIATWADGKEHNGHSCEYDPAWCNQHYCEFLMSRKVRRGAP